MSRGISLERIIEYFEVVNLNVGDIASQVIVGILANRREREERSADSQMKRALPPVRKKRKPRILLGVAPDNGHESLGDA